MEVITYQSTLADVDWDEMKATLAADDFDNGRSPEQLRRSFENSHATSIAYAAGRIIGTARVLSDGVCNAYVVDVWTFTPYRRRGVARAMIESLLAGLKGQHVYLFTDDVLDFYKKVGFFERGTGLERVVGRWLDNEGDNCERP
jgi:predicted GNAT family acetyltransferase